LAFLPLAKMAVQLIRGQTDERMGSWKRKQQSVYSNRQFGAA
jgi:hypothetical protein